MDLDEARAVIAEQHHAVLTTLRRDGTPQMSPVTATVDGAGQVVVSTRKTAFKVLISVGTHESGCVCCLRVLRPLDPGRRSVRIVELPEAMEGLVDYYRSVSGEHPDWADYRAAMEREERVLLQVDLTSAGPDREG